MLDTLAFSPRIIVAISFQKVDTAPYAKAAAESNDQGLKNIHSTVEEIHNTNIAGEQMRH